MDGQISAKPRDSFIEVVPATSNRIATERKIQGTQDKAIGVLEGSFRLTARLALGLLNSEFA
jgi:hypothetical protein